MASEAEDPGGGGSAFVESLPSMAPLDKVTAHLARVAEILLEEDGDNGSVRAALECEADTVQKFVSDSHSKTLLIERFVESGQEESAAEDSPKSVAAGPSTAAAAAPSYAVSVNVHFTNARTASVVFVKKGALLEAEKPVGSQLRVISLSDGSPYETLHSYVSTAVAPYFKSFVRESGKVDRDGDKMATSMEKKIAELEMGLLHLQQNIDIPEISLTVHPAILQAIKTAEAEQRKPRVEDLREKVEDSSFLNALQNLVSKWIREIQKVSKCNLYSVISV